MTEKSLLTLIKDRGLLNSRSVIDNKDNITKYLSPGSVVEFYGNRKAFGKILYVHSVIAGILLDEQKRNTYNIMVFDYGQQFSSDLLLKLLMEKSVKKDVNVKELMKTVKIFNTITYELTLRTLRAISNKIVTTRWDTYRQRKPRSTPLVVMMDIGSLLYYTGTDYSGLQRQNEVFKCFDAMKRVGGLIVVLNHCKSSDDRVVEPALGKNWRDMHDENRSSKEGLLQYEGSINLVNIRMSAVSTRVLLAAVLVTLLVGAVIVFLLNADKDTVVSSLDQLNSTETTASDELLFEGSGQGITSAEATSTEATTLDDTVSTSTTVEVTSAATTAFIPIEEDEKKSLPQCSSTVVDSRPQCDADVSLTKEVYDRWTDSKFTHQLLDLLNDVHPLHYDVNITVSHIDIRLLKASVELFVKLPEGGSLIPLHLHRTVNNLAKNKIWVRECETGRFVCVSSVTHLNEQRLLLVGLNETLPPASLISIYFEDFEIQVHSNIGLVLQAPSLWEKQRAWILATLFDETGARTVFPVVDQTTAKASWRLCLDHFKNMTSRSNMPSERIFESGENRIQQCFKTSPALRSDQFAFVIFDNLVAIHSDTDKPRLEVFVAKHVAETKWLITEVQTALRRMADLTGLQYPLEKLTVLSTPLSIDGTHDLGLIQVKDTWVEYPNYVLTHSILISQLVQQWISNVFTICDLCVQDGLASYIEWVVGSEYESIGMDVRKRASDARNRLLKYHNERAPLMTLQIVPTKPEKECVTKNALLFASIGEIFGSDAVKRFITTIANARKWGSCLSDEEIGNSLFGATNSIVSKRMFDSFASSPDYPTLKFKMSGHHLSVQLENEAGEEKQLDMTVPFGLLDNRGRHLTLVHNGTTIEENLEGTTVLANPNTTTLFRSLYDVDNYDRLANCALDATCQEFSTDLVSQAFSDLCWAHLHNKIKTNGHNQQWQLLFKKLAKTTLVKPDCACCMQSKEEATAKCKWTWKSRCSSLQLKVEKF
ncbi:unnamed protein product [Bursaphelenchus okinawaensis]|uniref:Aminopeptidase N-like N-terminal domain-containing protein n=1 Tax=Bursaphelenchus okinawaensis TaxID=465554 RepID=A0A811KIM5_9BILA|nr:unnamed protein product [Bursaphelenchus okinawaensis]CAG9103467.1 unnamed protein product [Bursaphelenchus okinawaensis]